MAGIQHVYPRGHIFWWRRIHPLFDGTKVDIRISLRTSDRAAARDRGASLTAERGEVIAMLEERIHEPDARPTATELKEIGKAAYERLLAETCDKQRASPLHRASHSAFNLAYVDFYQLQLEADGKLDLIDPSLTRRLEQQGWTEERIERVRMLCIHHKSNQPAIKPITIDRYIERLGYQPQKAIRSMVERVVRVAYRDACIEAEKALHEELGVAQAPPSPPQFQQAPSPAAPNSNSKSNRPDDNISTIAKLAAADRVADEKWGAKLGRQALSTGRLFELLIGEKPFSKYQQNDLSDFKRKLRKIPRRYDLTSEKSRSDILKAVGSENDAGGLQSGTINRHIVTLNSLIAWAKSDGRPVPEFDFTGFHVPRAKGKRAKDEREATSPEDLAKVFALPIYRGCQPHGGGGGARVVRARFSPGETIVHDAFYWIPLLTYYLGARREEVTKLMVPDYDESDGIPYLRIDYTDTGRIKSEASRRSLPLHSELVRLGFPEFVRAMERAGSVILFPECKPTNKTQNYGDVFYKNAWTHIKAKGELSPSATLHGNRHRFNTDLREGRVSAENRSEMMGHSNHRGDVETVDRYTKAAQLSLLLEEVNKLPNLTGQLKSAPINVPPIRPRRPRPSMRRDRSRPS